MRSATTSTWTRAQRCYCSRRWAHDTTNTLLHKVFPNGHLTIAGANSPARLASRAIRIVFADEVERYPASAGAEGDPVTLASVRSTTYWNWKLVLTSTPTLQGVNRIEAAYQESDQRKYDTPCPECGEFFVINFRQNIKWPNGHPEQAYCVCLNCGSEILEAQKHDMVAKGKWVASKPTEDNAGFWLNATLSPWLTWAQMAKRFVTASRLPETLRAFVNTSLGESWEDRGEAELDETSLLSRKEAYGAMVPKQVCVLRQAEIARTTDSSVKWSAGDPTKNLGLSAIGFHGRPSPAKGLERTR